MDTPPRLERAGLSSRCSSRRWWTSAGFVHRYILSQRDQGRLQCGLEAANANDTLGFEHGQRGAPTVSLATSATLHFSNYVYFTRQPN